MVLRLEILYPMSARRVVVIGAGAGGLMAAGRAAQLGADVTLLEKMESPGNKLRISGNTRCNLSNSRSIDQFIPMYGSNGKFLYSAFHAFFRDGLLELLMKYDVPTSCEADGRIFPASGRASDVVRALARFATENGARMVTGSRVTGIATASGCVTEVQTINASYPADAVVLATGGASYPHTGSTGDGYRLAQSVGHTVIKPRPALAPLVLADPEAAGALQGISLADTKLTSLACPASQIDISLIPRQDAGRGIAGRKAVPPVIESRSGSIVFTHYGISGPAALLMSLAINDTLAAGGPVSLNIDLLPGLSRETLEKELQRQFSEHGRKLLHNVLCTFMTARIAEVILQRSGLPADRKSGQVSTAERRSLAEYLKSLRFDVKCTRPLAEAMVTAGGICLAEIEPRGLQSRLVRGLYFCGEVMDIDADTGGYNLQAAFSTGHLAGSSAATA